MKIQKYCQMQYCYNSDKKPIIDIENIGGKKPMAERGGAGLFSSVRLA